MLKPRRGLFLKIVFIILIYLLLNRFLTKKPNSEWTNKIEPNDFYASIDFTVNTSDYLTSYAKFSSLKLKLQQNSPSLYKKYIPNARNPFSLFKPEYLILLYTTVFDGYKFCHTEDQSKIYLDECPYKNCKFSCDRSVIQKADSVLFHAADLLKEPIEQSYELKRFYSHSSYRKDQLWVLWNDEVLEKF